MTGSTLVPLAFFGIRGTLSGNWTRFVCLARCPMDLPKLPNKLEIAALTVFLAVSAYTLRVGHGALRGFVLASSGMIVVLAIISGVFRGIQGQLKPWVLVLLFIVTLTVIGFMLWFGLITASTGVPWAVQAFIVCSARCTTRGNRSRTKEMRVTRLCCRLPRRSHILWRDAFPSRPLAESVLIFATGTLGGLASEFR